MVSLVMTSSKKLYSVLKASDQTNQVYHGSSCLFYHLHIVCMYACALYKTCSDQFATSDFDSLKQHHIAVDVGWVVCFTVLLVHGTFVHR